MNQTDLDNIAITMDVDGDNAIEYNEFAKLFDTSTTSSSRAAALEEMVQNRNDKSDVDIAAEEERKKRKGRSKKRDEKKGVETIEKHANDKKKNGVEDVEVKVEEEEGEEEEEEKSLIAWLNGVKNEQRGRSKVMKLLKR